MSQNYQKEALYIVEGQISLQGGLHELTPEVQDFDFREAPGGAGAAGPDF